MSAFTAPVRRTLPDRSVGHAKIHHRDESRGARMPIESLKRLRHPLCNVNGSGSASANQLFARSILRMGVPAAPRNVFPSNIQGLPTLVRGSRQRRGHLGARGGVDMMVAMNPQTWDDDIASIELEVSVLRQLRPLSTDKLRQDITLLRPAADRICQQAIFRLAAAAIVQEHYLLRRRARCSPSTSISPRSRN